jgi:hypothetical protein
MGDKDIVSKDILKRIAVDIARVLLHLKVDRAEIIETEFQTIEDRRADLVAHMWGEDGEFILHIEIQNDNDTAMPWRMLRYRTEIGQNNPAHDIRQSLIYIGKAQLTMPTGIQQTGLDYRYNVIDMHKVDCQHLLTQDKPEALVLAILCDFKGRPAPEVVHFIFERLQQLTGNNESGFREYIRMLEILSINRSLEKVVEKEETMLSQVKYSQLPSFNIGLKQGLIEGELKGKLEGEAAVLNRLLTRRFGPISEATQARLDNATLEQLEQWTDNILEAATLDDVFKEN